MSFYYEGSDGKRIELGGESPYFADPDALRNYEVDYSLIQNKVTRFTHDARKVDLPITITADTEEAGAALMEELVLAFERDIRNNAPGRFWIDDYWTQAFVQTLEFDCDGSHGLWEIELATKALLPEPVWVLERKREFSTKKDDDDRRGMNYPHNFPFNFCSGTGTGTITNSLAWPCDVRIVIYGAATNPYIYIGENRYEVDVEVPEGGTLTIDGLDKSQIVLRDSRGHAENVFHRRLQGTQGSGTYIFEQVPSGSQAVTWDGSFDFDVYLLGERSWPPCST